LLPNAPADVADHHPDRVRRTAQHGRELHPGPVRVLRGRVHGEQPGIRVVPGQHAARLHRGGGQPGQFQPGPDHVRGPGERPGHVTVAALPAVEHVAGHAGVQQDPADQRVVHRHHGGELVVVHFSQFGGVDRLRPGVRDHRCHRLAREPHPVPRQDRDRHVGGLHAVLLHDRQAAEPGQVSVREHGPDARRVADRGHVDAAHSRVRDRAAHRHQMQHPARFRQHQVVHEPAGSGQQPHILDPPDLLPGPRLPAGHDGSAFCLAIFAAGTVSAVVASTPPDTNVPSTFPSVTGTSSTDGYRSL